MESHLKSNLIICVFILFFSISALAQRDRILNRQIKNPARLHAAIDLYKKGVKAVESQQWSEAEQYFLEAAEKGLIEAKFTLAGMYANESQPLHSYKKAAECMEEVLKKTNLPLAKYQLALYYETGRGVQRNEAKAFELMQAAADNYWSKACHELAKYYLLGIGTQKDISKALDLFERCVSEEDYPPSHYNLGLLYEMGKVVEKNHGKAIEHYQSAAEGGNAPAMYKLGKLYQEGYLVKKDLDLAVHWYRQAIKQGHSHSMTALAQLLMDGGEQTDEELINQLLAEASGRGDFLAEELLKSRGVRVAEYLEEADAIIEADNISDEINLTSLDRVNLVELTRFYRISGGCRPDHNDLTKEDFVVSDADSKAVIMSVKEIDPNVDIAFIFPQCYLLHFDLINVSFTDMNRMKDIAGTIIKESNGHDKFLFTYFTVDGLHVPEAQFLNKKEAKEALSQQEDLYSDAFRNFASDDETGSRKIRLGKDFSSVGSGLFKLPTILEQVDHPVTIVLFTPGIEEIKLIDSLTRYYSGKDRRLLAVQTKMRKFKQSDLAERFSANSMNENLENPLNPNVIWSLLKDFLNKCEGTGFSTDLHLNEIIEKITSDEGIYYQIVVRVPEDKEKDELTIKSVNPDIKCERVSPVPVKDDDERP